MRSLLTFILAMAVLVATATESEAEPEPHPTGTEINWITASPAPGDTAHVRVRGDALVRLYNSADNWRIMAGGSELPAWIHYPAPAATPAEFDIPLLWQTDPSAADLAAVLDRGEQPRPFSHLRLYFAAPEVLGCLTVQASDDDTNYIPVGGPTVMHQHVANGVLRVTDIICSAGNARYLKLKLPDARGAQLDHVTAWDSQREQPAMYEVNATLGPMRPGNIDGEHIWPLLLSHNEAPLAKLKVLADAPGAVRRIRAVRLTADGQPVNTAAVAIWADRLRSRGANPLERTEKWLHLPGSGGTPQPWGLVVEDGDEAVLQLTGVVAYAAEVELSFIMSEGEAPVELWLAPALEPREKPAADTQHLINGEVSAFNLTALPEEGLVSHPAPQWQAGLQVAWAHWGRIAIFALGALVALILALGLLRMRRLDDWPV